MTHPINQCPDCFDSGSVCERCLRRDYPDVARSLGKLPALAAPYGQDLALEHVGDPYQAFVLAPAIADMHDVRLFDCLDCQEFGTICRPCRKARYDARRAAERHHALRWYRRAYWTVGILVVAALAARRLWG